jgi:hypothetical protein
MRQAGRRAHLENANTATAFQQLVSEPASRRGNVKQFYALVTYNKRLVDSITALATHSFLSQTGR